MYRSRNLAVRHCQQLAFQHAFAHFDPQLRHVADVLPER